MRRAVAATFLLLLTCKQTDPIAATIHAVAESAEDRNAKAVAEKLSTSYADANGGRSQAEDALRRYFFGYRSIDIDIRDLQTFQNGPTGQARFVVSFSGVAKEIGGLDQILPSSATYHFDVWLAEENGEWKITNAQWRPQSQ